MKLERKGRGEWRRLWQAESDGGLADYCGFLALDLDWRGKMLGNCDLRSIRLWCCRDSDCCVENRQCRQDDLQALESDLGKAGWRLGCVVDMVGKGPLLKSQGRRLRIF